MPRLAVSFLHQISLSMDIKADSTENLIKNFVNFQEQRPDVQPRLFQCSNASGKFWVEEIFDFDQDVGIFFKMNLMKFIFLEVLTMFDLWEFLKT